MQYRSVSGYLVPLASEAALQAANALQEQYMEERAYALDPLSGYINPFTGERQPHTVKQQSVSPQSRSLPLPASHDFLWKHEAPHASIVESAGESGQLSSGGTQPEETDIGRQTQPGQRSSVRWWSGMWLTICGMAGFAICWSVGSVMWTREPAVEAHATVADNAACWPVPRLTLCSNRTGDAQVRVLLSMS